MFDIPRTYKLDHSDYITLPTIQRFVRANDIGVSLSSSREALLNAIVQYGQASPSNEETVQCWIDETLQEGIKEIHLYYAPADSDCIQSFLDHPPVTGACRHFCGNHYTGNLSLVNVVLHEKAEGRKIELYFCR